MEDLNTLVPNHFLKEIDENELSIITDRLSANMNNKFFFNPNPYKVHSSVKIFEDYKGRNLRQSYFYDCLFENCNLTKSGLAGSIFAKCQINPCLFIDTNLQSCDFRECKFNNVDFQFTRMNKSAFYKTTFSNCIFSSVSMNDALFDTCEFIDCKWTVAIEGATFKNTLFDNVKFKDMNFEFSTFENIEARKIKFPFPTIPFIYNGLKYLYTTEDDIRVTSAQKKEGLTKDEYLSYIEDLEKFYQTTKNYFPLSNIYIAQNEYEKAFEAIICGIKIAIQTRAFRMIKYYCKQLKHIENLDIHKKQDLYYFILNELCFCELDDYEKRMLHIYLPEIKDLLYVSDFEKRFQIMLETNIMENEFNKIAILMSTIDDFIGDTCAYSIEFRHNSPFQAVLDIVSNPDNIELIISGLELITAITFGSIGVFQNRTSKTSKNDKAKCEQYKKNLDDSGISINNVYIINNGNIYITNQNSSQGDIYLNK